MIGGLEVKVNPEHLARVREAARAAKHDAPDLAWTSVAEKIQLHFPEMNLRTLVDHVLVSSRSSDYLFSLYESGQISYGVFSEIATWVTNEDKDHITKTEILKHNMTKLQIVRFKKAMGDARNSLDTARSLALGEVPKAHRIEKAKRSVREFETIVDEIEQLAFTLLSRLDQVDDLIPGSILDNGEVKARLNKVAWDLRHATKITFEYIDARVKKFKEEIRGVNMKETTLAIEKEGEKHGR
jgi:hypothetical protein